MDSIIDSKLNISIHNDKTVSILDLSFKKDHIMVPGKNNLVKPNINIEGVKKKNEKNSESTTKLLKNSNSLLTMSTKNLLKREEDKINVIKEFSTRRNINSGIKINSEAGTGESSRKIVLNSAIKINNEAGNGESEDKDYDKDYKSQELKIKELKEKPKAENLSTNIYEIKEEINDVNNSKK